MKKISIKTKIEMAINCIIGNSVMYKMIIYSNGNFNAKTKNAYIVENDFNMTQPGSD